jgi:hypothetical protein
VKKLLCFAVGFALFAGMVGPQSVQAKELLDRAPNASQMAEALPRKALRAGVSGSALLVCFVRADGQFEKCEVENETPEGFGFGAAALRLGPYYRINMSHPRAKSLIGARIRQPIEFKVTDEVDTTPDAAKDLNRIPQPLLDAYPELAIVARAVERYGTAKVDSAPALSKGFFGGFSCDAKDGQDALWTEETFGSTYFGQHQKCLPSGIGRIRSKTGLEWIGEVARPIESEAPVPNGYGELRLLNGDRLFVRASFTAGQELFGWATPNGRFGVALQPKIRPAARGPLSERDPDLNLKKIASFGDLSSYFEIHNLNGIIVTTAMDPRSGKYKTYWDSTSHPARRPDTLRLPEWGMLIEGEISPFIAGDREAAAKDASVAGRTGRWVGWVFVTLEKPRGRYPAGRYVQQVGNAEYPVSSPNSLLVGGNLRPRDPQTLNELKNAAVDCKWKVPSDEVPAGWVVWTPACFSNAIWVFDPEAKLRLTFEFNADGAIVKRTLIKDYGVAVSGELDAYYWRSWEAERFPYDPRTGSIRPTGSTRYAAHWGAKVLLEPGDNTKVTFTNYTGSRSEYFEGPLQGLLPNGFGLCSASGKPGGTMEPCEYRRGDRVDAVYVAQVKLGKLAQDQADAERKQKELQKKQQEAQQQRDQEIADAQQVAEAQQRQRDRDEDAEASHRAIMQAFSDVKKSFARGASEMAATNRQSQAYVNQANQLAAQKQEQQRQDQQQAAQKAVEQKQAKDAYAKATQQAAAALAAAKAEASRNSKPDTSRLQAQQSNIQRQAAAPSSTSAQGVGGGTNMSSGGASDSSSVSVRTPQQKTYAPLDSSCGRMSMELMGKKNAGESACFRQKRDDESMGAWRDAESKCLTALKAQLAPLRAEYAARCDKPLDARGSKQ